MSDPLANNKLSQFALESPLGGGSWRVVGAEVDEDEEKDAEVGASLKAALLSDDKDEVDWDGLAGEAAAALATFGMTWIDGFVTSFSMNFTQSSAIFILVAAQFLIRHLTRLFH